LAIKSHDRIDVYVPSSKDRDTGMTKMWNKKGKKKLNRTDECRRKFV
jgi:hypothetical protein